MSDARNRSFERGATLTEVLVVMAISALVLPSLYVAITAGFRQERAQDAQLTVDAQLGFVSRLITDDIQEHWISEERDGDASAFLSLEGLDARGSATRTIWYVDGSTLVRLVTEGEDDRVVSKEAVLEPVTSDESTFRYWTADGNEVTPERISPSCITRVSVSLITAIDEAVAETTLQVALRASDPEASPC